MWNLKLEYQAAPFSNKIEIKITFYFCRGCCQRISTALKNIKESRLEEKGAEKFELDSAQHLHNSTKCERGIRYFSHCVRCDGWTDFKPIGTGGGRGGEREKGCSDPQKEQIKGKTGRALACHIFSAMQ